MTLMEEQDRRRAVKLKQLRQDMRDGLNSGDPAPWDAEEIKRAGRQRRGSRTDSSREA